MASAAAEESRSFLHRPPPVAFLPSYREMILEAIEALTETNSSSISGIDNFILSSYGDLPDAHNTLLSHHLDNMTSNGELILVNGCYVKPGFNAPQKRGRGRPPKAKTPLAAGISVGSPRPRGRPPKVRDPFTQTVPVEAKEVHSGSGKPRGRPPKKAKVDDSPVSDSVPLADSSVPVPVPVLERSAPRGRGRPPKVKTPVGNVGALEVN